MLGLVCHLVSLYHRLDEGLRLRGNDCIAVTAQSHHSGGSPISQRECAGFNWPPLTIPAEEPVNICPVAVSRTGSAKAAICPSGIPLSHGRGGSAPRFASVAVGLAQPASHACRPSSALIGTLLHSDPSL